MAADLKSTEINSTKQPSSIQVPKPKWRPKTPCQYKDIIKDNMEGYEYLEQFVHKCTTIRRHKQQYSSPTPDPSFKYIYTDAKDKTALTKNLILADYPVGLQVNSTSISDITSKCPMLGSVCRSWLTAYYRIMLCLVHDVCTHAY